MSTHIPLNINLLYALAPTSLPSFRYDRYDGSGIQVALHELAIKEQQQVLYLYATLQALQSIFEQHAHGFNELTQELRHFALSIDIPWLVQSIHQLGHGRSAAETSVTVKRVMHDIKGGGFAAAIVTLQMLLLDMTTPEDVTHLSFLARDHLAIMRNCVVDLDPNGAARRYGEQPHDMKIIEETWNQAHYTLPTATASIHLQSLYQGAVASSATEFAALRRTIYNLINNAVRFTTDSTVHMAILGLPQQEGDNVRFVIYNRVAEQQRRVLEQRFPNSLGDLFQGGFSTGGSGLGMRICSEFIAEDYGVNIEQCIKGGYVGAKLIDDIFVVWFHWPALTQ